MAPPSSSGEFLHTFDTNLPIHTDSDVDVAWNSLKPGLDLIMSRPQVGMSFSAYMGLYTIAYDLCTQSKKKGYTTMYRGRLVTLEYNTRMLGSELYSRLTKHFTDHLHDVRKDAGNLSGDDLLHYYANEWGRYTTGAKNLNRLLAYLNRQWVKRELDEGRKGVYPVYVLALVQWKQVLFDYLQTEDAKLVHAVLRLIEKQRDGDTINLSIVKTVVDSFVSLGIDEYDPNNQSLHVYKEHFEEPFLRSTEKYYELDSDMFLSENPMSSYISRAKARIEEEELRVERYLMSCNRKTLIAKCEDVLIRRHVESICEEFQTLLKSDKHQGVRDICTLMARIPEGLSFLRKKYEDHLTKSGLDAVHELVESTRGSDVTNTDASTLGPKEYIDMLLNVIHKNSDTATHCFHRVKGFAESFDKACREFVNRNSATRDSATNTPELLARYADSVIRKNNKVPDEQYLDEAFNKIVFLFKYVEDKDMFQTFYASKLSKRLLHCISVSRESEVGLISMLKEAGGFEYTDKLQRMFTDLSLSEDLTKQFNSHVKKTVSARSNLSFNIMVLGTSFWALNAPTSEFHVPKDILSTYESFNKYYQNKHSGRKLTWLWNYSKNELQTNHLTKKYILTTSSYQMAALLMFNEFDSLTLKELVNATGIEEDVMAQVLESLTRSKIILSGEVTRYELNPNFISKKTRLNLTQRIKYEAKTEVATLLDTVQEDRKYVIQATVVRIMKARKTMNHRNLVQETVSQLSQRFKPFVADIKKAIDSLVEKEYIERMEGTRDTFAYLA